MGFDLSGRPINNVYEEEQKKHFAKSPLPQMYDRNDQLKYMVKGIKDESRSKLGE